MGEVERAQGAVSSVIGTVLILGITVSVFAGVSIVVLGEFDDADDAPRSELGVVRGDAAYLLRHGGGDPVPLDRGVLLVGVGPLRHEVPMAEFADQTGDGTSWRLGESLCVSCLFPEQDLTGVLLVVDGELILSEGTVADVGLVDGTDLALGAPAADPAVPLTGDVVTLSARATNAGGDAVGPVVLEVLVDGASVGTDSVASLPSGYSAVLAVDWTSTTGTHAVAFVLDPGGLVAETNEANNQQGLTLDVTASVPDPGFAYRDPDRDGRYTNGVDTAIPDAEVLDGAYDAGADGLVLPASLGPVSAATIAYSGASVEVHVDLTAQTGALAVTSTGRITLDATLTTQASGRAVTVQAVGAVDAPGATVTSAGDVSVQGTALDLAGATLTTTTSNRAIALTATDAVDLDDADVNALGPLTVTAPGAVTAQRIDLDLLDAGADLTWTAAAIDLTDATFLAHGHVTLDAVGDLLLGGVAMTMQEPNKALFADADGTLTADAGTSIILQGAATLEGGVAVLDGLSLSNTGGSGDVVVQTTVGSLSLADASLTANGHVTVSGATSTDASGTGVTASGGGRTLRVEALGGSVDVRTANLAAQGDLFLSVPSLSESVLVDGAILDDKNAKADVTPDGAAVGTPASGGVE